MIGIGGKLSAGGFRRSLSRIERRLGRECVAARGAGDSVNCVNGRHSTANNRHLVCRALELTSVTAGKPAREDVLRI